VIAMSRRAWTPETATPEQLQLRQAAIEAFQRADRAEAEGYALAGQAHTAGVPMEDLAEQTGRSRATLFRRAKKSGGGDDGAPTQ
jgi:DNA-binding MurR/RpiR family transcriptional regulator